MQRKVREVLVLDRVELIERDQVQQMRKFEGGDSLSLQHLAEAANKILDIRTCANTLFAAIRSAWPRRPSISRAVPVAKNNTSVSLPAFPPRRRTWPLARCRSRAGHARGTSAAGSRHCSPP